MEAHHQHLNIHEWIIKQAQQAQAHQCASGTVKMSYFEVSERTPTAAWILNMCCFTKTMTFTLPCAVIFFVKVQMLMQVYELCQNRW